MRFDQLCRYGKEHEWIRVEGGEALVGITDYAQDQLSNVVFVELPEIGDEFQQGDVFAVVESVKAASDIYSPLSGKIVKVNDRLADEPQLLNSDPYGEGWVFELEPSDLAELEALMPADEYQKTVEEA